MSIHHKLLVTAGGAALGLGLAASPAMAANQQGLVNVSATNTTVQVPVAVAANICGVAVNALTGPTAQLPVTCTAKGVSIAQSQPGTGQAPNQRGLVNVALTDTTVQVPITVAANVCGVAVNVLAAAHVSGPVSCTALPTSTATG